MSTPTWPPGPPAPTSPPPAPPGPAGRPGRSLVVIGVVLLVIGAVGGLGGLILGFAPLFGEPPARVQGTAVVELEAGEELALYRVGAGGEGVCRVTGPDGRDVELDGILGSETLTLDGEVYRVVADAEAATAGPHEVTCTGGGYAVGPRVGVLGLVGTVLAAVFGGGLLVLLGIVALVIGLTRRRSADGPGGQIAYGAPPPWRGGPPAG